jgi:hypothetical protein
MTSLSESLADRDVAIVSTDYVADANPPGDPIEEMRLQITTLSRPDVAFLETGAQSCTPDLQRTVAVVREVWGDVPIILCGSSLPDRLLALTGADALYAGQDEASLLHLLGTFGFRLRKRRAHRAPIREVSHP